MLHMSREPLARELSARSRPKLEFLKLPKRRPLSMNTAVRKGYETGRTTTMLRMVRIRMTAKDLQASQKRLRVGNSTERKCLGRLPKQYPTSYTSTDAKASFIRFQYITQLHH